MPRPTNVAALSSAVNVPEQASAETFQAAAADELAVTVEHILSTRYASAGVVQQTEAKPQRPVQVVTSESLLAELAAAKASRPSEPQSSKPDAGPRSRSPMLRLFAFVGCAMIAYALLMKSPWRDQVPAIDRVVHLLN